MIWPEIYWCSDGDGFPTRQEAQAHCDWLNDVTHSDRHRVETVETMEGNIPRVDKLSMNASKCPDCDGVPSSPPCDRCDGAGVIHVFDTLEALFADLDSAQEGKA